MTVAHSRWQNYNKGQYVAVRLGETDTVMIDIAGELTPGDYLVGCRSTGDNMVFTSTTVRIDTAQGYTTPHQMLVRFRPTSAGIHTIELQADTINGLTIVKHFDVLVEE